MQVAAAQTSNPVLSKLERRRLQRELAQMPMVYTASSEPDAYDFGNEEGANPYHH